MTITNYKHLQEPIRIKIASGYLQHEMRKIFPRIRDKEIWKKIDREVKNLSNNTTMAPVRDFWNLVDSICFGLKLKNLVPRLTSQNIKWSKEKVKIDDLYMGAKRDFKCLEKLDIEMPNGRDVKDFLFNKRNLDILKFAKNDSLKNSKKTFDRNLFPIIIGPKNQKMVVYDGNRRFIKSVLEGKVGMVAYKATVIKQPMFYNYWIPTSRILDLVTHANLLLENNDRSGAKVLSQSLGSVVSG